MQKVFSIVFIVGFCIIVTVPPAASILQTLGISSSALTISLQTEKRDLTAWPDSSVRKRRFTDYTAQINSYFEDRIIFRKQLLEFAVHTRYDLLKVESNQQALIGQNGWLYLKSGVENAVGINSVSDDQLTQWADNALKIKALVEQKGGVFLVMIPPDKVQLYPEYIPSQIEYSRDARLLNRLQPLLDERGIATVDLLEHLLNYKSQSPSTLLYSKTDTHWTHRGALWAYQNVIDRLNENQLGLSKVDIPLLKRIDRERFSGDVADVLGLSGRFDEPHEILLAEKSYTTFAPSKKLLVFGDSFSGKLIDFWRYSFKSTHCYHHNIGRPNLDLIDQLEADVVILQVVERSLIAPLVLDQKISNACF